MWWNVEQCNITRRDATRREARRRDQDRSARVLGSWAGLAAGAATAEHIKSCFHGSLRPRSLAGMPSGRIPDIRKKCTSKGI